MIHTISIAQNKRMFYNYLIKMEYLFADAGKCPEFSKKMAVLRNWFALG